MQASVAADLWAVGAMAFEVLCGRQLFPPLHGRSRHRRGPAAVRPPPLHAGWGADSWAVC